MRQPPINRIAKDAIKAWKISAMLSVGILWIISIAIGIVSFLYDWSHVFWVIGIILSAVCTYIFVFLVPKLRWRRWRYEVFEQEIYIQHGILIVSRTLVPMIRVQHVDTKQGPILKKFQLASVTISTAATTHEIPALLEEDASDLRDKISALARVDDDDV
ncbi:PH domain-containing protein [Oceanobacillus halotolerans]|uniref:PH domain-containing protein n=1 Tax=Oceanobacillus halotolerans TaxID=2663380 RepID=UPI0013DA00E7|nr:PH domain-containing protein [Oceanobacillus halotolerans]